MSFAARGEFVKLGKGAFFLDLLDSDGASTGFEFAGNCPSGALSSEPTQVEMYSSTEKSAGLVRRDKLRINYTVTVTLNEYTLKNLQMFLNAERTSRNQASGTSVTKAFDNVIPGRSYSIGDRQVTSVVVNDGSNDLVLNTDYALDAEHGMVTVIEGGSVQEGDDLVVTYNRPALTIDVLRIGKGPKQIAHFLYLGDDVTDDAEPSRDRLEIWKCDVAPEGDLGLIGDEYGSFQLTMAVLTDAENHADDPYGILERVRS